ncbi:MAG TPA: glycoside hydrolase family protein [Clostridia bacterium]|nr:glycoside hydrolase family protein [Clostridia bacterium]
MIKHSLKDQLILHERIKLKPYKCSANKWTIGVGRNLEAVGLSREEQAKIFGLSGFSKLEVIDILLDYGITKEEALYLLDNDIEKCTADVKQFSFFESLNPVRQKIIIDMRLNLGLAGLMGFKRMLGALEAEDYVKAAEEMKNSKWYWEVGNRSRRLVKMMATGHDYDPKERFDLTI